MLIHYTFGIRLRDEKNVREPRVGPADVTEIDSCRFSAIHMQHQARGRSTSAGQDLAQSDGLQDFQSPGLHCQCARLSNAISLLVDYSESNAKTRQLTRKRQPRWSGSNHKNIRIVDGPVM